MKYDLTFRLIVTLGFVPRKKAKLESNTLFSLINALQIFDAGSKNAIHRHYNFFLNL